MAPSTEEALRPREAEDLLTSLRDELLRQALVPGPLPRVLASGNFQVTWSCYSRCFSLTISRVGTVRNFGSEDPQNYRCHPYPLSCLRILLVISDRKHDSK